LQEGVTRRSRWLLQIPGLKSTQQEARSVLSHTPLGSNEQY